MRKSFAKSAYSYFLIWGICSSLSMTISTIVDAFLVGNLIGSNGLAVANLATPVFLTYALFGITIGVGANVHIGRMLGASDVDGANRVFRAQLGIGLLTGLLCLTPLLFREFFFGFLGVTTELLPLAKQYLTVVLCSGPVFILYHVLSVSVRVDSDPKLAATASAVVILVNLSLDLLFMKVFNWGIIGASASLCIAEALGVLVLLLHFLKKRSLLRLRISLPRWADLRSFAGNGFGMGSAYIFQALVMLCFNLILLRSGGADGALHVAIYGVIYTISMIPFAVFDGASNSLSTVTSFFVGESDVQSILALRKRAVIVAAACGAGLSALCFLFAGAISKFFGFSDAEVMKTAVSALQLFSLSILFTGINTVVTAFWQSIGRARLAGIFSVLRNCLLMLAFGFILVSRSGINGLSLTYIVIEGICTLLILGVLAVSNSRQHLTKTCAVSGRTFESNYIIRTESMEQISNDLNQICDDWEIGMKQAFFINFICEELLLNIIKFGLKDNSRECYVDIRLMERGDDFILRIRDNVSTYNPFESTGDEIDAGVLHLITKKTKYYDYQRKMIFNYLYMVI